MDEWANRSGGDAATAHGRRTEGERLPCRAEASRSRSVAKPDDTQHAAGGHDTSAWAASDRPVTTAPGRSEAVRNAVICVVLGVCMAALLIPAVVTAVKADAAYAGIGGGQEEKRGAVSRALCRIMISSALPPTDRPLWALRFGADEATESSDTAETPSEADEGGAAETESDPFPDQSDQATAAGDSPEESSGPADEVGSGESTAGHEPGEPTAPADPEPVSGPTEPDPAQLPIISRDMSESEGGSRRIRNDTDLDPSRMAQTDHPQKGRPIVLVITSHPFETYADGVPVADLAEKLAAELRAHGVSVVLIRPSASGITPETSFSDAYDRTRALARYECLMYADTALVLDVRRSAELAEGEIRSDGTAAVGLLRTVGSWDGKPIAQLRLITDARRSPSGETAFGDYRFAQSVRDRLYKLSATVSRPVWLRDGNGLLPATLGNGQPAPILLTAELGAAGNTSEEAARLVPLLARAAADLLRSPDEDG